MTADEDKYQPDAPGWNEVHGLTPPADDVREALIKTLGPILSGTISQIADAILAAFEVRPHGLITDAFEDYVDHLGVDANEDHDGDWWDGYRQAQRDNMRQAASALGAARGARP